MNRRALALIAIVLILDGTVHRQLGAAPLTDDPVARALDRARRQYENRMEKARDAIEGILDKEQRKAERDPKPDADRIDRLVRERDAFREEGAWPSVANVNTVQNRAAKAAEAMLAAYTRAYSSYARQGDDERRDAVSEERDRFERRNDLVPWQANLLGDAHGSKTMIHPETPLRLDIGPIIEDEFRVEVRAEQLQPGTLTLEVHGPEHTRSLEAIPDEDGNVRLLATVGPEVVSADLGARRPPRTSDRAGDEHGIVIRIDAGAFEVASVKVKPNVRGAPPQRVEPPKREARRKEPPQDPSRLLTVGSTWSGARYNARRRETSPVRATVTARDANTVTLRTPSDDGTGALLWTLAVRGDDLRFVDLRYKGPRGRSFTEEFGSGRVRGNQMRFDYSFRFKAGPQSAVVSGWTRLQLD